MNATLLYFLNLELINTNIEFGAGIFVDLDKEAALRLDQPEDKNTAGTRYGRLVRDQFPKIPVKKDLFQICVTAAAGLTVDEAYMGLDVPIPGLEEVKAWIPSLNMGTNSSIYAVQAIVKKELAVSTTSKKRGRRMKEIDRRRLEGSIPPDAHRGLRMLSCPDPITLGIDCDVNTTAGEFACAKLSEIRLDVSDMAW